MASFAFGGFGSHASDDDESGDERPIVRASPDAMSAAFLDLESSDDDQEKRVVRSEKDKRWDEMSAAIKQLRNHVKINDWMAITEDFEDMLRICEKAAKKVGVPRQFIKQLLALEETVATTLKDKARVNKMKKPNSKALNSMKQQLKKRFRTPYERQIEAYLKNPAPEGDDDDEDEDEDDSNAMRMGNVAIARFDDDDDDNGVAPAKASKGPKAAAVAEEDDQEDGTDEDGDGGFSDEDQWSDDDWGEMSDGEDDDDEDVDLESHGHAIFTREFWTKKASSKSAEPAEEKKSRAQRQLERAEAKAKALKGAREKAAAEAGKGGKPAEGDVSQEMVVRKLKEVLETRGRRNTNRVQQIQELEQLLTRIENNPKVNAAASLKVKTTLANAYFETSHNTAGQHMPVAYWRKCLGVLQSIILELMVNPLVRLTEDEEVASSFEDSLNTGERITGDEVSRMLAEVTAAQSNERQAAEDRRRLELEAEEGGQTVFVQGNLFSLVQRMATEYTKSLRNLDPLHSEYVDRLRDENKLVFLMAQAEQYYAKIDRRAFLVQVILLRLEYIHYIYHKDQDVLTYLPQADPQADPEQLVLAAMERDSLQVDLAACGKAAVSGKAIPVSAEESRFATDSSYALVRQLATYLYQHGDARSKMRALLLHVYYLALHNHYREARELLQMSHVADHVDGADILTRVLYNRTITQLGLAAFRRGQLRAALDTLNELYQIGRTRELLAQGTSRQQPGFRDPDKEREERRRQYPFHMHINLDVIEGVTLLSALAVEAPTIAKRGLGDPRAMVSRNFHRLLSRSKQGFGGPPESTRDFIVAASQAVLDGDWPTAWGFVQQLKLWKVLPSSAVVQRSVRTALQQSALHAFLLGFAALHCSLSMERLQAQFELPELAVRRVISRLLADDNEFQGALDVESRTVALYKPQPNRLQRAALKFVDNISSFAETNERLAEFMRPKRGRFGGPGGRGDGQYNRQGGPGGRGPRGQNRQGGSYRGGNRGDKGQPEGGNRGERRSNYRGGNRRSNNRQQDGGQDVASAAAVSAN